jgi:hypothetical protein
MKRIAIVGPEESKWATELQKRMAKDTIHFLLFTDAILVSGHCPKGGVDIWAEEIADNLGIQKIIFAPEVNQWEDPPDGPQGESFVGYKTRNMMIAQTCDVLYCIVPHNNVGFNIIPYNPVCYCKHCEIWGHPTNGGCWTMKYANKIGKETHLEIFK